MPAKSAKTFTKRQLLKKKEQVTPLIKKVDQIIKMYDVHFARLKNLTFDQWASFVKEEQQVKKLREKVVSDCANIKRSFDRLHKLVSPVSAEERRERAILRRAARQAAVAANSQPPQMNLQ